VVEMVALALQVQLQEHLFIMLVVAAVVDILLE
jgi:hypothetical protein